MPNLLTQTRDAIRAFPVYAGLLTLGLMGFAAAGWQGYRLLGDNNESTEGRDGPPRAGGHGGSYGGARFYHK